MAQLSGPRCLDVALRRQTPGQICPGGTRAACSGAILSFTADANSEARAFSDRFEQLYKDKPDVNAAWPCDGLLVLAEAINGAGSTDPEKVRSAVLAIRGFKGVEGECRFDENGDGLHGYNIVRNKNGRILFDRASSSPTEAKFKPTSMLAAKSAAGYSRRRDKLNRKLSIA